MTSLLHSRTAFSVHVARDTLPWTHRRAGQNLHIQIYYITKRRGAEGENPARGKILPFARGGPFIFGRFEGGGPACAGCRPAPGSWCAPAEPARRLSSRPHTPAGGRPARPVPLRSGRRGSCSFSPAR